MASVEPSSEQQIMELDYPSDTDEWIRIKRGLVLLYDHRYKGAKWVCERLTPEQMDNQVVESGGYNCTEDTSIELFYRSTLLDYSEPGPTALGQPRRTALNKGHLAAAANHKYNQAAYEDTFTMSNIAPMYEYTDQLLHYLERKARKVAKRCVLHICTGPIYSGNIDYIGENRVAVPSHFFKVLYWKADSSRYFVDAYIAENVYSEDPNSCRDKNFKKILKNCSVDVQEIANITQLRLLRNISPGNVLPGDILSNKYPYSRIFN